MVDQTPLRTEGANGRRHAAHGSTFKSTQTAARNMAHLMHDAVTLAQLQFQLLLLDCEQAVASLRTPTIAIAVGGILALSSIPVALFGLVFVLTDLVHLTRVEAIWITFGVTLIVAGLCIGCGIWWLRSASRLFESSRVEWSQNVERVKEMLRRSSHPMQDTVEAERTVSSGTRSF